MSPSSTPDVRWRQRLSNLDGALTQLAQAVQLAASRELSELEKQGLIQAFEFTHELSWNVMKDYLEYQGGGAPVSGSRDATREAFNRGLISDGAPWMEMIKSRNQTSHTYNKAVAQTIVQKICDEYCTAFQQFRDHMQSLAKK
jgi:nucleotidyltransferase substrate binding protein (TIGR01987 family)